MPRSKPFYRIYRSWSRREIKKLDDEYAVCAANAPDFQSLMRAYYVIQDDLERVFEFVEPTDANVNVYSVRTFELLLRACVEVEANCRAILRANSYSKKPESDWTMKEYCKVEQATHLSDYSVQLRTWHPTDLIINPFAEWKSGKSVPWYRAYNECKHNRANMFSSASLLNSIKAVAGLYCVLFAQFGFWVSDSRKGGGLKMYTTDEPRTRMVGIPGGLFDIDPFDDWTDDEKYGFSWEGDVDGAVQPFDKFSFV